MLRWIMPIHARVSSRSVAAATLCLVVVFLFLNYGGKLRVMFEIEGPLI
jgi:hypothetical protein